MKEKYPPHVTEKIALAERGLKYPVGNRPIHLSETAAKAGEVAFNRKRGMDLAVPLAVGENPTPEYRSELEKDYADFLEIGRLSGEVLWWMYEPMSLNLGGGAKYKFDFLVQLPDCTLECVETKGFWRESHRVRIKVAAARFPILRFKGVTRDKDGWHTEEFKA